MTSLMTALPHRRHPGLSHFLSVSPQGWLRPLTTPTLTPLPVPFHHPPNTKLQEVAPLNLSGLSLPLGQ